MALTPTVAAFPSATDVATMLLSTQAALSGVATDFNKGSQVRTIAESLGAVIETETVGVQALALQTIVYGALALFGITVPNGQAASGIVTFSTALPVAGAPVTAGAVPIPAGTVVATAGGVQYTTRTNTVLSSGASSIDVGILCTTSGTVGNAPAGAIYGLPLTSIGYPLFVSNGAPLTGGSNAGTLSNALAAFTARVNSLGLASPVAVANAAVGVTTAGETVRFAACFEGWLYAGTGVGSGTAGFTVIVDNGSGGASSALLAAVRTLISGSFTADKSGFRPAGVPYSVRASTPLFADVVVSGTLVPGVVAPSAIQSAAVSGIQSYFNGLGIGASGATAAYQPQIAGAVADAGLGLFESLSVNLFYSGSSTPVPAVTGIWHDRVLLGSLSVDIEAGT